VPMRSIELTRGRPVHALARAASWHRRKLAVLAALAAVLTGISAAAPDGPAMITVVKARSQLPGGTVVSAADLVLDRVAASDIPEGALTDPDALIGKTLAAPVAENQILTPLTASVVRTSVSPGHVIAPLRLADTALRALIRPGDVVDVIAANTQAEQAVVVAAGARVVTRTCPTTALVPVLTGRSCSSTWMLRRRPSWRRQPLHPHSASFGGSADRSG
jgi:pilus assembly protein CpaB